LTSRRFGHTLPAAVEQTEQIQIHASCVELGGIGVLLLGESGSGKSDLALRLIDAGGRLVADDRTDLRRDGVRLIASPPAAIAGRMEVRGLGIVALTHVARAPVALAVELVAGERVERMPDARRRAWLGVDVHLIALNPFEASAAAKVRLAAREATRGRLFAA
jgi:serine kinase of HPr protein (carbohydrate metabolism regulator)